MSLSLLPSLPSLGGTRPESQSKVSQVRPLSARTSRAASVDRNLKRRCLSARKERFTPEEQAAFGRCGSGSFLATVVRRRSDSLERPEALTSDDSDDATECTFLTRSSSGMDQTPCQRIDKMCTRSSDAVVQPLSVESPVRKVLAQIFPVEDQKFISNDEATSSAQSKGGHRRPPLVRRKAVSNFDEHERSFVPVSPKTDRRCLIERFRTTILNRFRSVHDAFAQFDGKVSRDRALSPKEFRLAGMRLGISESELSSLFKALDTDQSGQVTLTEFLHGLVEDISPESLLWELRCRLDAHGIRANNVDQAFDLIRQHELGSNKGRKPQGTLEERQKAEKLRYAEMRRSKRLGRTEWMRLGMMLGLTLNESERLFGIIDSDASGTVDLPEMFKALQRVAPDVTLERFVTKVIMRYGSYQEAFKTFKSSSSGAFGFKHFQEMAAHLDINDRNTEQIWTAWDMERRNAMCYKSKAEEAFVSQMKAWAPDTVLDHLREQMLEQYGSVVQGQKALQDAGLPCKTVLSSSMLDSALRTAGFCHCEAAALLKSAARCKFPIGSDVDVSGVTLQDVFSALQNPSHSIQRAFGDNVGVYWQQLHALKTNLRIGNNLPEEDVENIAPLVVQQSPCAPCHLVPAGKSSSEAKSKGVAGFIDAMQKEEGADCAIFRPRSRRNSRPPLLRAAVAA
eukprot:gnl/MRDRNA2_/MRDRNA2_108045_c0_seq1.p1 gnl/MRDRNA2_/MRDRNA2_108045_c0~~gnl/MRDRNA2_/MRDRNA2_108045_c0_seq1.p1  ORF type:complete len:681 (-),score=107.53 gnl/MRDRNA2_/MRDRNA2_108045_c0_seq1:188-2230(-)